MTATWLNLDEGMNESLTVISLV